MKRVRLKSTDLYDPVSDTSRVNVNFLRSALFSPKRKPGQEYVYQPSLGKEFAARISAGECVGLHLPTVHDGLIIQNIQTRAQEVGGQWIAEFESGDELYKLLGIETDFDIREAAKLCNTLHRVMKTTYTFKGTWITKKSQREVCGISEISLIIRYDIGKSKGKWSIRVHFNPEYMKQNLEGYNGLLPMTVLNELKSDFAICLFRWFCSVLANQQRTYILPDKLVAEIGFSDSTKRSLKWWTRRLEEGVEEINLCFHGIREYVFYVRREVFYFDKVEYKQIVDQREDWPLE